MIFPTLLSLLRVLAAVALLAFNLGTAQATTLTSQPKIGSRQIPILRVDNLKFRDLNRNGRLDSYEDWRLSPKERAIDLVSRMSLAEKAGTMMHHWILKDKTDMECDLEGMRPQILGKHITSFITNMRPTPPFHLARQNNTIQELAEQGRLGIPLTISTDPRNHLMEGRRRFIPEFSIWPEAPGFGAIGDPGLVHHFAEIIRQEYRALGIHMALSPVADLGTEPRWGRVKDTFGEDPKQVYNLVRAYVEGIQGSPTGLTRDGVISVVKHWAGYGAAAEQGFDGHNDYGRWSAYPGGNFSQHLVPYEGAFEVKVAGVMPTYTILRNLVYKGHSMEQVGGGFNKYLLTDLLRGYYGFDGMVLSDFGITLDDGMPWGVEKMTPLERYVKGVQAGIDQFGGVDAPEYLIEAVEGGLLDERQLDAATQRILSLKFQIGLFENPYVSPEQAEVIVNSPQVQKAAVDAQQRSLVLLKNGDKLLPLQRAAREDRAALRVYLLGVDAAAAEAKGLRVESDASQADLAIVRLKAPRELLHPDYFFGRMHAEGNLAFFLGQPDFDAVVSLATSGLPVIASVYLERPAILTALLPHVQALFADFGITDEAFLDVLLGKAAPEGRLPFELARSMSAVEAQKPDLPHDSENPLFSIGFGLRYEPNTRE